MDPFKRFLRLPWWVQTLIGAVSTALMFLLVWWMASEAEKREDTFLDVCWQRGEAHYLAPGEKARCPSGVESLHWAKPTKTVRWDLSKEFNVYLKSHYKAVQWINDELGFEALQIVSDDYDNADIVLESGTYSRGSGAMSTAHTRTSSTIKATIRIKAPQNIRAWMLEEEHELLHALGLAHDATGIMSKSLDESNGMRVWRLHNKDKKALRNLIRPSEHVQYP